MKKPSFFQVTWIDHPDGQKVSPEKATWNTKSALFGSILVDRNEAAWLLICWQCATYKGFFGKRRRSHLQGLSGPRPQAFLPPGASATQRPTPSSMLWIFFEFPAKDGEPKVGVGSHDPTTKKQLARSVPILFDGVVGNQEHGSGRCRMRCRGGAGRHGSATRELRAAL